MLYQISNGAVAFGDDVILHSIDFEIRNTEKIAIVGRNGCGKTTLLKLISGEVEMEKLDSDESAFIAKAGNPEIGYLKQIAFDDPDVTLEQEVRKCFVKMDERKAERKIGKLYPPGSGALRRAFRRRACARGGRARA